MRNFLHLNNGNGTFSDISQLAGMHKSDWSWSCLFMDADNDSRQDIFVANGYWRDIYNKDKRKQFDDQMMALKGDMNRMNQLASTFAMSCPIDKIPNVMFKKNEDLTYTDVSKEGGHTQNTISTGAAYGDLDNDGDLDVVVNNLGDVSQVIENVTPGNNNYIRLKLSSKEHVALGAKAILTSNGTKHYRELLTTRGYQSSSESFIHFGLGKETVAEKIEIIWPSGKKQTLTQVPSNTVVEVKYNDGIEEELFDRKDIALVQKKAPSDYGIDYAQKENYSYDDYKEQVLLPHKVSQQGPFISKGDVNNDGLEDFYIGSPKGQAGKLYVQTKAGKFKSASSQLFELESKYEDGGSSFVDVDGDKDFDLIVASAGYEFDEASHFYQPRLYINNGNGKFSQGKLPEHSYAGSCVRPCDYDNDGDMDVYIGGLLTPKKYPQSGQSAILVNDGKGKFTIMPDSDLTQAGMVKDAVWIDLNGDKKPDLMVVGEWMPISFYVQKEGTFINATETYLSSSPRGWWNSITTHDLDGNGYDDYVIGNLGLNYKYKASADKPFKVYSSDMDSSGSYDIVLSTFYKDKEYPVRGKSCSAEQIPGLKNKVASYHDFSISSVVDIYGDNLNSGVNYSVDNFKSIVLYQSGPGKFTISALPLEAQTAPTNAAVVMDVNKDQKPDIIIGGNLYQSEIETGRADFGTGKVLINLGNKEWDVLEVYESGLYIPGDVKSMTDIETNNEKLLLVGNNRGPLEVVSAEK